MRYKESESYVVDSSLIGIITEYFDIIKTRVISLFTYFECVNVLSCAECVYVYFRLLVIYIYIYKNHKLQIVLLLCEPGNTAINKKC